MPKQTTRSDTPAWLTRHGQAFELAQQYVKGDAAVKEKMQQLFAAAMEDKDAIGPVTGNIGLLILRGVAPTSLFRDALNTDYGKFLSDVADHFVRHAKEVGIEPKNWSRRDADLVWDALVEKKSKGPKKDDWIAIIQDANSKVCASCPLYNWIQQGGHRDDKSSRSDSVKDAIRAAATNTNGDDPRKKLETELETARTAKAEAVQKENFAEAQRLVGVIKEIEDKIATLSTKPIDTTATKKAEITAELETARTAKAEAVQKENFAEAQRLVGVIKILEDELEKLTTQPVADPAEALAYKIANSPIPDTMKDDLLTRIKVMGESGETLETIEAAFRPIERNFSKK